MKRLLVLVATMFAITLNYLSVQASIIDAKHASQIASDFLSTQNTQRHLNVPQSNMSLRHISHSSVDPTTPTYYIVINEKGGDWVVIAADDRIANPVLGYGNSDSFDYDNLPCNMRSWLNSYSEQIEHMQGHPEIEPDPSGLRFASTLSSVTPMLTTTWGQGSPYNAQCPKVGYYRAYTGCVATAMAQVMYYHRYPVNECIDIPAYTSKGGINLPALPATEFDWDNMLPSYSYDYNTVQSNAVAQLMRYCGQAIEMNYGTSISTGTFQAVPFAMNYFF